MQLFYVQKFPKLKAQKLNSVDSNSPPETVEIVNQGVKLENTVYQSSP